MKKSRLIVLMSALAVMAAMVLVACGGDDSESDSTSTGGGDVSSELIAPGTLTVGSDIPYRPFEFGDSPDYEGFDISLVNEIAKRLDLEVVIKDTAFDTIVADVARGKFDLVASALSITPEREQQVAFSDPYFESAQALVVPPDSDINSVEDLRGLTVGVQDATTGEMFATDETEAGEVRGFPGGPPTLAALKNGQVEAVLIDEPVAQDAINEGEEGYEVAKVIPTGEFYGLATAKKNSALIEAVNGALAEMKKDGGLDKIFKEWFDRPAPASVTAVAGSGSTE